MNSRRWLVAALLLAAALSLWALVDGGPWLQARSLGGLPAGNAIAALLLCTLAAAALFAAPPRSAARKWGGCALVAALAWLPVSIGMAGNLALNFHGRRGEAWGILTLAVVAMIGASLAWATAAAIARRLSRNGQAPHARR